jgi:nucleotidyltransferase/DNA polymerase involved in DNA repair
VEAYSIDESFLFFPEWKNTDFFEIGKELKYTVTKETGIPVSVGIAPNKTLAKMCNKLAKKRGGVAFEEGVCDWNKLNHDEELKNYPVGDIWGVGQSKTDFLKRHGVNTALDLKNYPIDKAKKYLTITGYKTVRELNGIKAIDKVEEKARQVVIVSRSFQKPVYELNEIIVALSEYTQEAAKNFEEGLNQMNANGSVIFTQNGYFAREFAKRTHGGMVGVNVGIPVPAGMFPFDGHKNSFFGDLHCLGKDGLRFYTESKVLTTHWFDEDEKKATRVSTWDKAL